MQNQPHRVPDSRKYRPQDTYSLDKAKQQMNRPMDLPPQRPYALRDLPALK